MSAILSRLCFSLKLLMSCFFHQTKWTCSIIDNDKAKEYFRIDPSTCVIKLRKSLALDPDRTLEYPVSISTLSYTSADFCCLLIWIQTIWYSDSVPERIFWKKKDNLLCKVSVEDSKSMENYPACKELIQSTLDISNSKGLDKICRVISSSR